MLRNRVQVQLQLEGDDDVVLRYDGRDMDNDATTLEDLQDKKDGDEIEDENG